MLALAAAVGLWCLSPSLAKGPGGGGGGGGGYALVTLDNREGLVLSWVNDVREANGSFVCVGYQMEQDGDKAVAWQVTPSGSGFTVTPHYLDNGWFADAINVHGQIVGDRADIDQVFGPPEAEEPLWLRTGLYWPDRDSPPLSLPPLAGDNGTEAAGINAAGVIVGRSSNKWATYNPNPLPGEPKLTIFGESTVVAWRVVGSEIEGPFALGSPSAGAAYDINECDADGFAQVAGNTTAGAVLWEVDCLSPTLASTGPVSLVPPNKTAHGAARAINDAGDACGDNTALAFRYPAGGVFQELSTPRNAYSEARDINDSRQVVGQVFEPGKGTFAALWQTDGSRVYLYRFLGRTSDWERIWWGTSITANGTIGAVGAKKGTGGNDSRALLMIAK
jgi:hypothetical protein